MEWTFTLETMPAVANAFWDYSGDQKIFAFHGNLGAGKTTFIHALCRAKEVSSTVGSPSFSIINEYHYPGGIIYHVDLYRLKDEEEAFRAGVEDCLYSGNICLVEWPEKARHILPPRTSYIHIFLLDPKTRKIRTEASPELLPNSI
jgi:tRNA threonylcarbamoyladenosine biosynthesis protein TsaE